MEVSVPNAKLHQVIILIVVAGCTTQPGNDHGTAKVSAANADVQCHSTQTTGSLVAKTVCTTKAQRDAQQADLGELKREVASQSAGRCSGQGC
jgi:hypothetical protein